MQSEVLKRIFVTEGNASIGRALCKQLASEDNFHVYMDTRSLERGSEALKETLSESRSCEGKI